MNYRRLLIVALAGIAIFVVFESARFKIDEGNYKLGDQHNSGAPIIGKPFDIIPHSFGIPENYFHCPTTIVAANGDLLVASGQGRVHGVGNIVQARSTDGGESWNYEGVIYDHGKRNPSESAYGTTFARAPDGRLVLLVQTTNPELILEAEAKNLVLGGEQFAGCVYLISDDHGKTYEYKGYIDPETPHYVEGSTSNILTRNGTIYLVSPSFYAGVLLYTSEDNGETWQRRSAVFPSPVAPREWEPDVYTAVMRYPTFTFLPDGSIYVLGLAYLPDGEEKNYSRVSVDGGKSWGPVRLVEGISVRCPVLHWVGDTLVLHGRYTPDQDMIMHTSIDQGVTWSPRKIIQDYDTDGGYSSSVNLDGKSFMAFSTDKGEQVLPRNHPQYEAEKICGIQGVFLYPSEE